MNELHTILQEIADAFVKDRRNPHAGVDGDVFWRMKDREELPQWLQESNSEGASFMLRIHEAIDGRGPDDWVYLNTYRIARWLAENAEYNAEHGHEWDAYEAVNDCADNECDIYTMDRLKWLASNLHNYVLCDEAAEGSGLVGILDCIVAGQCEALRRIGQAVVEEAQREKAKRDGHEEPEEEYTIEKTPGVLEGES